MKINLEQFGTGSSGAKQTTGEGAKKSVSLGEHGVRGGGGSAGFGSYQGQRSSGKGEKVSAVTPDEDYTISVVRNGQETSTRDASGRALLNSIRNGALRYNRTNDTWVTTRGTKVVIRKRKK